MALSKLNQLYRAMIIDHASNPHHHGSIKATVTIELNNPTCGDVIKLFVKINEQDVIEDLSFEGSGCSISIASASMMSDVIIGKKFAQAEKLIENFSILMQGKEIENADELGEAEMLSGIAKFPQRIKCATLAWNALRNALTRSRH